MESLRPDDRPSPSVAVAMKERQTVRSEPVEHLGARPNLADRAEYLFCLRASSVFLLGMSAFLGYIYLEPLRERLYQAALNRERWPLRRNWSHISLAWLD